MKVLYAIQGTGNGHLSRAEDIVPYLQKRCDVDILVSLSKPSYSLIMGLYLFLEKKLNMKVDITRKGPHISQRFLKNISKDIIYV